MYVLLYLPSSGLCQNVDASERPHTGQTVTVGFTATSSAEAEVQSPTYSNNKPTLPTIIFLLNLARSFRCLFMPAWMGFPIMVPSLG
jgi:hypothetical protein